MSYELHVFAARRPPVPAELAELADGQSVDVDEIERIDIDDVPDAAASRLLAPRWQVIVHARQSKGGAAEGRKVARAIAERCDGVVYDPQADKVVWPRGTRRMASAPAVAERRVDILRLTWCFSRRLGSRDCRMFLATTDRLLPEVRPKRWGATEPFQGRGATFCDEWDGGETIHWRGTFPVYSGSVRLGRWLHSLGVHRDRLVDTISLSVDAAAATSGGESWAATVELAFERVGRDLGAFFGIAHLETGWIARGGALWADHITDRDTHSVVGDSWLGLPPIPCWLMWLGAEYRAMVAATPLTAGASSREAGPGVLLRLRSRPDERRLGPEAGLDSSLFRGPDVTDAAGAADRLPAIDWEP